MMSRKTGLISDDVKLGTSWGSTWWLLDNFCRIVLLSLRILCEDTWKTEFWLSEFQEDSGAPSNPRSILSVMGRRFSHVRRNVRTDFFSLFTCRVLPITVRCMQDWMHRALQPWRTYRRGLVMGVGVLDSLPCRFTYHLQATATSHFPRFSRQMRSLWTVCFLSSEWFVVKTQRVSWHRRTSIVDISMGECSCRLSKYILLARSPWHQALNKNFLYGSKTRQLLSSHIGQPALSMKTWSSRSSLTRFNQQPNSPGTRRLNRLCWSNRWRDHAEAWVHRL